MRRGLGDVLGLVTPPLPVQRPHSPPYVSPKCRPPHAAQSRDVVWEIQRVPFMRAPFMRRGLGDVLPKLTGHHFRNTFVILRNSFVILRAGGGGRQVVASGTPKTVHLHKWGNLTHVPLHIHTCLRPLLQTIACRGLSFGFVGPKNLHL